ncbi:uncharacterized protein ASCRUDRAFT_73931 [Ascoidea rubescens DSM 1968]|uniref:Uncharacterized protein n=1 Tax=Ascoidea rubescens DSM 1968 TaxID=1344418 RepID=A0A1D2VRN1_9ASCO|nr:hypothetical protein ASCRUDRAFT_73931 [Ascoidea rubescens DSM 1968]ODV64272.1 hypothetical protein ASCRUDRAFT_73931 [Ascoidea rubescens DSM 1968]
MNSVFVCKARTLSSPATHPAQNQSKRCANSRFRGPLREHNIDLIYPSADLAAK